MTRYLLVLFIILTSFSCEKNNTEKNLQGINIIGTSNPAEHGFDTELFEQGVQRITDKDFGDVSSMIIIHKDELIYEKYFGKWSRKDLHYIASDTKSITSLLVGIAKDQGKIPSLDEKIVNIFSDIDIQNLDARKENVTVKHLLTMTGGFEWDEWSKPYNDRENSNNAMNNSNNMAVYVINKPMAENPGEKFVYNSGSSVLLGEIIKIKTGKSVTDFAKKYLFDPLEIPDYSWVVQNNVTHCGGGLELRPIDMAKIGYLALNKGNWNGAQIVSEEWIDDSFHNHTPAVPRINYGYQWWNFEVALDILEDIGHASGFGGQFIFIIKELDMVIVLTGENDFKETKHTPYDLLFSILASNNDYKTRLITKYEWVKTINMEDYDYSDSEYMNVAFELITYSKNNEAIEVLNKLSEEKNKDNWFYYFLYGKAYYGLDDRENAALYLNKHIELNKRNSLHDQAYYQFAQEMLNNI